MIEWSKGEPKGPRRKLLRTESSRLIVVFVGIFTFLTFAVPAVILSGSGSDFGELYLIVVGMMFAIYAVVGLFIGLVALAFRWASKGE